MYTNEGCNSHGRIYLIQVYIILSLSCSKLREHHYGNYLFHCLMGLNKDSILCIGPNRINNQNFIRLFFIGNHIGGRKWDRLVCFHFVDGKWCIFTTNFALRRISIKQDNHNLAIIFSQLIQDLIIKLGGAIKYAPVVSCFLSIVLTGVSLHALRVQLCRQSKKKGKEGDKFLSSYQNSHAPSLTCWFFSFSWLFPIQTWMRMG